VRVRMCVCGGGVGWGGVGGGVDSLAISGAFLTRLRTQQAQAQSGACGSPTDLLGLVTQQQPSPAQPSPAQHSPAQHSRAQQSTAEHSTAAGTRAATRAHGQVCRMAGPMSTPPPTPTRLPNAPAAPPTSSDRRRAFASSEGSSSAAAAGGVWGGRVRRRVCVALVGVRQARGGSAARAWCPTDHTHTHTSGAPVLLRCWRRRLQHRRHRQRRAKT
jgi:hypothetical protein